jgi:hypothetical protein
VKRQQDAILNNSLAQPLEITISLSPTEAEFVRDHTFWTGESPEQLLIRLCVNYAKPDGEGADRLWEIARNPRKRAAAFKRNSLEPDEIASLNQTLDAAFEKLRQVWERETVKSLKRMPAQNRAAFLCNLAPEEAARFLMLAEA